LISDAFQPTHVVVFNHLNCVFRIRLKTALGRQPISGFNGVWTNRDR
jgi:hypothetical protein